MRKLFIFSLILIFNFSIKGQTPPSVQCAPDTSILNSPWGLWPDTIQNLPHATITWNYNTTLQLKTQNLIKQGLNYGYT